MKVKIIVNTYGTDILNSTVDALLVPNMLGQIFFYDSMGVSWFAAIEDYEIIKEIKKSNNSILNLESFGNISEALVNLSRKI